MFKWFQLNVLAIYTLFSIFFIIKYKKGCLRTVNIIIKI